MMDNKEKIQRMANPKETSDYGLSITVSSIEEADEIFRQLKEAHHSKTNDMLDKALLNELAKNDQTT